jgi:hypothetical protein
VSDFERIAGEVGRLVTEKDAAYGRSVATAGTMLAVLYPDGVRPEQYRDLLLVTRVLDKLKRVANRKDAFAESPWRDIAGYGVLGAALDEGDGSAVRELEAALAGEGRAP